jgi:hypothetical protein
VDESSAPCDFPLCSRSVSIRLRLLVDQDESMLGTCEQHAEWLRRYVQEDDAVEVVDELPPRAEPLAQDLPNLA